MSVAAVYSKKALKYSLIILAFLSFFSMSCKKESAPSSEESSILGFGLLSQISGHWVGSNQTSFGPYDWFTFDFRPISASHVHSIYEGGTNQNIITSIFIADFEGQQQVMARNGGWLGNQYRATYFVLDRAEETAESKYYRLVDAVGKENRAYMEFRFENGIMFFDAYKDNSGSLDAPVHHMGFEGTNYNPEFASTATELFDFPQAVSEVNLEGQFVDLIDPDSALFLEEALDPFPKSMHGHLSDLTIAISRVDEIAQSNLLLYISTEPLVDNTGQVNFENLDKKVVRTIDVHSSEDSYRSTYLHPDDYFITVFSDTDGNGFPSSGEISSVSKSISVEPETEPFISVLVDTHIP